MKHCTRVLATVIFMICILSSTAFASTSLPPRWPQPEWYAQFYSQPATQTPTQTQPSPTTIETPKNTATLTAAEQHIFDSINKERQSRGIPALILDTALLELARMKSQDMIDNSYFAHRSPVYGSAYDMMRNAGIRYNYAGENLAKTSTPANAVNLFMNSSIHRNTLLNPRFSRTGVGVVQIGRQIYVTQMFTGFSR